MSTTRNENVTPMPARGKLVIDGWNMYRGADGVLAYGDTVDRREVDLGRLANQIAAKATARLGQTFRFTEISCHIGVADPSRDSDRYLYEMDTTRGWKRDSRVSVHHYINKFDEETGKYREQNVDDAIGEDLLTSQASGDFDSVVLFSEDSDLTGALETGFTRCGRGQSRTRVEVAKWDGQKGLWLHGRKGLWCHYVTESDLDRCSTRRGYGHVA